MQELLLPYLFDLSRFLHSALFLRSQKPWEPLLHLREYLENLKGNAHEIPCPEGTYLVDPQRIFLSEGVLIEPGVYMQGPIFLGRGSVVRQGAYLRGYCLTGEECVIGHATEVKNSILLDKACAAHFAYLGETILGNRVNLGAGVKCANLKFDRSPVVIRGEFGTLSTGMHKLGAIVGDDVQIGCNAVTNPGTIIGPRVRWYPCVNSGGVISADSVVRCS